MKKYLVIGVLIIVTLLMGACSIFDFNSKTSNNDWSYALPNDYVIWHINSRRIVCGKRSTEQSIANVGGNYVVKFCYNNQFICLQCVDVPDNLSESIDESNPQFYIINTVNDEIFGPLSKGEYLEKTSDMNFDNLSSWISTKPRPEGAQFS